MRRVDVSVIIPIYNSAGFLAGLLENLKAQTYRDSEYILVDDGSNDGSAKLINKYIQAVGDERFHLVSKKNGGVSSARNIGLDKAVGKYIIFIDSDDEFEPNMIEKYVSSIETHSSDLEFFSAVKVKNGNIIGKIDYAPIASNSAYSVEQLISLYGDLKVWGYPFCFISKRSLWGSVRFDENIGYQEDVLALFQVWHSDLELKAFVNSDSYYHYVMNGESALHTMKPADYWQAVNIDDQLMLLFSNDFKGSVISKIRALKMSSLMNVIAASLLANDNINYEKAREVFLKEYKFASFSKQTRLRRMIQKVLLKLNCKSILTMMYRRDR